MSAYTWLYGVSGDWSTATDWSGGAPDSSTAGVTIATAGIYTVTIGAAESFTVGNLTLDDASATLDIGGTLNLTRTLFLTAGTLDLAGTINGGTIDARSGKFEGSQATFDNYRFVGGQGALNGVKVEGTILLNAQLSSLTIENGLDVTGTNGAGRGKVELTGIRSVLDFDGSQSFDNATIYFGSNAADYQNEYGGYSSLVADDLTLGSGVDIISSGKYATIIGSITNNGAISAVASGGRFYFGLDAANLYYDNPYPGEGAFTNNGSVSVSNGDTLVIEASTFTNAAGATLTAGAGSTLDVGYSGASWSNAGTITATGATLNFNGSWTNTGAIDVSDSTVSLSGAFNGEALNAFAGQGNAITVAGNVAIANSGNILRVGAGSGLGTIILNGGAISGGTIADSGSGFSFVSGAFNAVTYQGVLDLSAASSKLTIYGGITLTGSGGSGAGSVNLTGDNSTVVFSGSQSLDNATIDLGSADTQYAGDEFAILGVSDDGGPATLILGANLNIDGSGLYAQIDASSSDATIHNEGLISANASGGLFILGAGALAMINTGSLSVSNGDTLTLEGSTYANGAGGTITAGAGSTLNFGFAPYYPRRQSGVFPGNWVNAGTVTANGATLNLYGASFNTGTFDITDSTLNLGPRPKNEYLTNDGRLVLSGSTLAGSAFTIGGPGSLSGSGAVAAPIANAGLIEASGGMLTLQDAVTGAGGLQIDAGATLTLGGALAAGGTATFNGANADLAITAVSGFADTIAGLAATDEIDLLKTAATSAVVNGSNQLVVTNNGAAVATFNLSGSAAGLAFTTGTDNNGGAFIVAGATPAPHASLHLFRQYVAAGFGDHAAPLMDPQDHLAMAQPHHDFAAGRG